MAEASKGYPFYLTIYDEDGMHGDPIDIPTEMGLKLLFATAVKDAVAKGREVVVTDCEDFCVFHAKDGKILFPT